MSDVIITVIGAGVIGTSLGLALKQMEDPPQLIVHDKSPERSKQAVRLGAFDKTHWNLINACENADLIVLAIPASAIKDTLAAIADDLKEDVIVSDVSRTKQNIVQMAQGILPPHAHFVGGHPIVHTDESGPQNARADLFQERLYCLTPTPSVLPEAVKLLDDMVKLVGATPFYLDPLEHDGLMSSVNGLPALLSLALVHSVSQPTAWKEARKLAGGMFANVSAGATGDPDSLAEELLHNKANIIRQLDASMETLGKLKTLLQTDQQESLTQLIDETVVTRDNWYADFTQKQLSNLQPETKEQVEKPSVFKQLFGFGKK